MKGDNFICTAIQIIKLLPLDLYELFYSCIILIRFSEASTWMKIILKSVEVFDKALFYGINLICLDFVVTMHLKECES